jgi:acyl-CoA-binding protein/N-acetylneuraminic acid mutarotase
VSFAELNEESKLLLYALEKQSISGPCDEPKPWGWNVVNNAKWQSWKQLGDMSKVEAMRLYVRTLEEEVGKDWWSADSVADGGAGDQGHAGSPPGLSGRDMANSNGEGGGQNKAGMTERVLKRRSVAEVLVEGSWVSPYIENSQRPTPRYEHSVAVLGSKAYLMGGNYAGRYMSDTWMLDLESLSWSVVCSSSESPDSCAIPPSAGHAAVAYNGSILLIGGHERLERVKGKVKNFVPLKVYVLDAIQKSWSELETSCAPMQRGGHSVNLVGGSKLFMFGGENPNRKPSNELWVLDLQTNEWSQPDVSGEAPSARSSHSAVTYLERYIVIFGGGSVANCFNDVVILDTQTMSWVRPAVTGAIPPIRAGHAAAILGSLMFMIGGGNNSKGCADMYSLDLKNVGRDQGSLEWVLIGNTPPESAIASEGLSLTCLQMAGCLMSFGGYNGKYHSAIHVYRPESYVSEKLQDLKKSMSKDQSLVSLASSRDSPVEAEASKRETAARLESTSLEVDIMRKQLASANKALADAEKVAEAAREALAEEEQKNMHLQVQVSELKREVERVRELEREIQRYRLREANDSVKGKKTGLWGYISGNDVAS